ncbi:hypothetical protein GC163_09010 [bacterium]|nr:hypothetical protein [bacterium]
MLRHKLRAGVTWMMILGVGCSDNPGVTGGTTGCVTVADSPPLADLRLAVHSDGGGDDRPIGFGVTNATGCFELFTPGARQALWLEPGDYRITVETIGPDVVIPAEFTTAKSTPLVITWPTDDQALALQLPPLKPTPSRR